MLNRKFLQNKYVCHTTGKKSRYANLEIIFKENYREIIICIKVTNSTLNFFVFENNNHSFIQITVIGILF